MHANYLQSLGFITSKSSNIFYEPTVHLWEILKDCTYCRLQTHCYFHPQTNDHSIKKKLVVMQILLSISFFFFFSKLLLSLTFHSFTDIFCYIYHNHMLIETLWSKRHKKTRRLSLRSKCIYFVYKILLKSF